MTKYVQTTIAISIHPTGTNPIFGEQCTHVKLEDDAGGIYIELNQMTEDAKPGVVKFDITEWEYIAAAVKKLINNAPRE